MDTLEKEKIDSVAPLPIPSSYLVLHKLKQWDECQTRARNNPDSNAHLILVRRQLFTLLKTLRYSIPKFDHDPTYDPNLHNESAARVDRFLAAHHCYAKEWRKMGLRPSEGSSQPSEGSSRPSGGSSRPSGGSSRPSEGSSRPSEKLVRPRRREFSVMQIRSLAAQTTVAILAELGLPCAIFGSMACKLYGNRRIPNDIDILVLPPPERASITQEEIKALIFQHALPNYHFILKPARDPSATYKVLHFIAKPRPSTDVFSRDSMNHDTTNNDDANNDDSISQEFTTPDSIPRRFSSKVDILLPGVMHLPALPTSMITQLSSLPLVPFPVLLLQKLQGWADHSAATEARYRRKISVDSRDLEWCLNSRNVKRHLLKYVSNGRQEECLKELWSDRTMFSEEFEALSRVRVREFCEVHTGLREAWKAIGFDAFDA